MKIRVFNMKWPKGMPDWTHPARKEQTYVELSDKLNVADKGSSEYHDEMIYSHILEALKPQFAGNVPLEFEWDEQIKDPPQMAKPKDETVEYSSQWQNQLRAIEGQNSWRDYI